MSDVELIFAILAVIYGWECACWLRAGTLAFRTGLGKIWRAIPPGKLLGNQQGGFVLAFPLPPLGTLLQSGPGPVSISPEGVLAYVATNLNPGPRPFQSGRWVPFDQLDETGVKGKWVLANGQRLVHAGSIQGAGRLKELLEVLKGLARGERERKIRELCASGFSSKALNERWDVLQRHLRVLRRLANGLFVFLFLLAPLTIWFVGFRLAWPGLLIGWLALALNIAILFLRAHRELYPKLEDERFTQFIIVLLSPANAIRAMDLLSRPALEAFHPVAVAEKLFTAAAFRDFAGRCLRDLRHPACPRMAANERGAREAEKWFRQVQLESLEAFLARHGLPGAKLTLAPNQAEAGCVAYCPRCLAQFMVRESACGDCGGLPLVTFEKRAS